MRLIGTGNLEGFEVVVRSLSAGDVVCLESQAYKCLAVGWETSMALPMRQRARKFLKLALKCSDIWVFEISNTQIFNDS